MLRVLSREVDIEGIREGVRHVFHFTDGEMEAQSHTAARLRCFHLWPVRRTTSFV